MSHSNDSAWIKVIFEVYSIGDGATRSLLGFQIPHLYASYSLAMDRTEYVWIASWYWIILQLIILKMWMLFNWSFVGLGRNCPRMRRHECGTYSLTYTLRIGNLQSSVCIVGVLFSFNDSPFLVRALKALLYWVANRRNKCTAFKRMNLNATRGTFEMRLLRLRIVCYFIVWHCEIRVTFITWYSDNIFHLLSFVR